MLINSLDALEIVEAETDSLRCSGMTLDSDSENNLVLKGTRHSIHFDYLSPGVTDIDGIFAEIWSCYNYLITGI